MNKKKIRILEILIIFLIAIAILMIDVFAATTGYENNARAKVTTFEEVYYNSGAKYPNPIFIATVEDSKGIGYTEGQTLPGVCNDHLSKADAGNSIIYAKSGRQEITDPKAKLHIGHHVTKWKETGDIFYLKLLVICLGQCDNYSHTGNIDILKDSRSDPGTTGGSVEFSGKYNPNNVTIEKEGDPGGTGAGTYSVGPFYIKVEGESIPCHYQNDYGKTWTIEVPGVTGGSLGNSRTGAVIDSLEPGENEVYVRFYASDRPTEGKAKIFFSGGTASYKVWYTDWTVNHGQSVTTYDAEKVGGDEGELELPFKEKEKENPSITLQKVDEKGSLLSGATFKITITNVKKIGSYPQYSPVNNVITIPSIAMGQVPLSNIEPADASKSIKITLEEITPPSDKYEKISPADITLTPSGNTWKITAGSPLIVSGTTTKIPNSKIPEPSEGNFVKKDAKTGALIKNAKFNITPSGKITSVSPSTTEAGAMTVTWASGPNDFVVTESKITSTFYNMLYSTPQSVSWHQKGYQEGTIVIEETQAPKGYKKINGKITIKVKRYAERTGTQSLSHSSQNSCTGGHHYYCTHSCGWSCYEYGCYHSCSGCYRTCSYMGHESGQCHGYNYTKPSTPGSGTSWNDWGKFTYEMISSTKDSTVLDVEFKNGDATIDDKGKIVANINDIPIPEIEIELKKINTSTSKSPVKNAEFKMTFAQAGMTSVTQTGTTNSNGILVLPNPPFKPEKANGDDGDIVTVTIEEVKRPDGYKLLSGTIVLKLKPVFDNGTNKYGKWSVIESTTKLPDGELVSITKQETTDAGARNKTKITIEAQDKSLIEKFTLSKLDLQTGSALSGATFKITLENAIFKDGTNTKSGVKNGDVFEEIEILNVDADIKITAEEESVPVGYKKIVGKMTIILRRTGDILSYKGHSEDSTVIMPSEFDGGSVSGHNVQMKIKNIPIIRLGGQVWLDGELDTGKNTNPPNGKMDSSELKVQGIRVRLYTNSTSNKVQKNINGKNIYGNKDNYGYQVLYNLNGESLQDVRTDSNGNYNFGRKVSGGDYGIEKAGDYFIVFEYDGINYITKNWNDSKATEIASERTALNNNFKTISGSGSIGDSDKTIGKSNAYSDLEYTHTSDTVAILKTTDPLTTSDKTKLMMGSMDDQKYAKYRMHAQTGTYIPNLSDWVKTWTDDYCMNINMGLVKKEVDLSLAKDVESALVSINKKDTTYKYNQMTVDSDGNLKVPQDLGNTNSNEEPQYNLYIYESDYNFRIKDYVTDGFGNNVNPEDATEIVSNLDEKDQLRVFVTYRIVLNNQLPYGDIKVNQIVDYFDSDYTYVGNDADVITRYGDGFKPRYEQNGNLIKNPTVTVGNEETINGKKYTKLTVDNLGTNLGDGGQQIVYLTFEANHKDKNINNELILGTHDNIAEITSYTTAEGGLVDRDSAPGNEVVKKRWCKC